MGRPLWMPLTVLENSLKNTHTENLQSFLLSFRYFAGWQMLLQLYLREDAGKRLQQLRDHDPSPRPGMVTIKFQSELPTLLARDSNQVSSVFLLMTSSMALASDGLFELTRRPLH